MIIYVAQFASVHRICLSRSFWFEKCVCVCVCFTRVLGVGSMVIEANVTYRLYYPTDVPNNTVSVTGNVPVHFISIANSVARASFIYGYRVSQVELIGSTTSSTIAMSPGQTIAFLTHTCRTERLVSFASW